MGDEPEPAEYDDQELQEEAPLRRAELLAKVREVNKRSVTGPDSPGLRLFRSDAKLKAIMRKVEVTGDGVRRGDVLEVGGLLHRVRDVRELRGRRKRLEFEDGNAYVLGPAVVITVARVYDPRGAAFRPHGENTTLQRDFG